MTDYAWVIEEADSPVSAPRYYTLRPDATHFWSHDHMDALRFARKQDAEDYVSHFVQVDGARICEHGWEASSHDNAPTDPHHGGKIWEGRRPVGKRECDCCGEMKYDTRAVYVPTVGDTVVCEDCSR